MNFNPICNCRPVADELLSFPKFAFPIVSAEFVAPGRLNVGVLVKLNASARNCTWVRSDSRKFLNREKSRLLASGPHPTRRCEFPNRVNGTPVDPMPYL